MQAFREPLRQPGPITFAVLGDSLAYGLGASAPEAGFANLLHAQLRAERPASTLFNFAVPHSTMGDVLRHQVPKLRGIPADIVLVIAGANDLRYTRDVQVIARRFEGLLHAIAAAAPGAQILAGGMPDVTQTIAVPRAFKAPIARLCARINDRMRAIATASHVGFVDMYAFTHAPLCAGASYLCDDGFHPNDFGYAEIARRAYPELQAAVRRALSA